MTLRLRLLLALVGLVAAGLLIADSATYLSLRFFLMDRVDQQLLDARSPVALALPRRGRLRARAAAPSRPCRPGRTANCVTAPGSCSTPSPSSTAAQYSLCLICRRHCRPDDHGQNVAFTAPAASGGDRYRVLVQNTEPVSGVLIVAVPLAEVQQTLSRLVLVEVLVTLVVLVVLGVLAWWLVRRELRPLEGMAAAAGRIAAGDLSERVAPAERQTEVGRLGLALNGMLEHIELAFAERTASEERLRRFLADASHELRTPLTSIRGYAEMFHRGAKDDPEDLGLGMRRIEEEGERMGVMVDELLLLARLDEGREPERAPVDLARLVEDAVSDARAADPGRTISSRRPLNFSCWATSFSFARSSPTSWATPSDTRPRAPRCT